MCIYGYVYLLLCVSTVRINIFYEKICIIYEFVVIKLWVFFVFFGLFFLKKPKLLFSSLSISSANVS